jgi:hypothetical protein
MERRHDRRIQRLGRATGIQDAHEEALKAAVTAELEQQPAGSGRNLRQLLGVLNATVSGIPKLN